MPSHAKITNTLRHHNPTQNTASWFSPANYAQRINDCVTFSYFLDCTTYFISLVSDSTNDYITNGVPAIINGISCLIPSLIPFLPNIVCISRSLEASKNTQVADYENRLDTTFDSLIEIMRQDRSAYQPAMLDEIVTIKKRLLTIFINEKSSRAFCTRDNVVNTVYLVARVISGILLIIKGYDNLHQAEASNLDDINKSLDASYIGIYGLYCLICLLPPIPPKITASCASSLYYVACLLPPKVLDYCASCCHQKPNDSAADSVTATPERTANTSSLPDDHAKTTVLTSLLLSSDTAIDMTSERLNHRC